MVQRIRIRGHIIRTLGVRPSTSRIPPESCPSCLRFYDDDKYRRCIYLCCEFEDCLDCVVNQNNFYCEEILDQLKLPRLTLPLHQRNIGTNQQGKNLDTDESLMPLLSVESYDSSATNTSNVVGGGSTEVNSSKPEDSFHLQKNTILQQTQTETEILRVTPQSTNQSGVSDIKYRDFARLLEHIIPKHHWTPVVHVDSSYVQTYSKQQIKGTRRRGRPRKLKSSQNQMRLAIH